jgi:hypothetical protein
MVVPIAAAVAVVVAVVVVVIGAGDCRHGQEDESGRGHAT